MKKNSQIEIDEYLLAEAEVVARREAVSVRDLAEEGLRLVIAQLRARFHLGDAKPRGDGVLSGVDLDGKAALVALIYEEHLGGR